MLPDAKYAGVMAHNKYSPYVISPVTEAGYSLSSSTSPNGMGWLPPDFRETNTLSDANYTVLTSDENKYIVCPFTVDRTIHINIGSAPDHVGHA